MKIKSSRVYWTVETEKTSVTFGTRSEARSHKKILKTMYKRSVIMYKNTQLFNSDIMPETTVLYKERKH